MNKNKGPFSWLENLINPKDAEGANKDSKKKRPSKYMYVLVLLLLGVGTMIASNLGTTTETTRPDADSTTTFSQTNSATEVETFKQKQETEFKTVSDYENYLQSQMKEALESINGVADVKVVIYVEATEKSVFEKNKTTQRQVTEETDKEGGKRTVEDTSVDEQLVIVKSGDKEGPIVVETKKPKVSGVLVVAKGAENIKIKKWIVEAVTRALDVPSHRVSVMPKK